MREEIFILGKGNFALSIILDILKLQNCNSKITVVSNIPEDQNSSSSYGYLSPNLEILEITHDQLQPNGNEKYLLGSIGRSRAQIFNFFFEKYGIKVDQYHNLFHPSAIISDTARLGKGIHVSPLSIISPFTELGNFCVVNRNCSIGHHTIMEDFACVNPGVNVSGLCHIGSNVTIGTGATIIDKIKIGKNSIIGAGSVVTKDIPENVVAYGSPAKVIREI